MFKLAPILTACLAVGASSVLATAAHATQLGLYIGAGCAARSKLAAFESFLGRRVDRVQDAADQRSWAQLASSAQWTSGCWRGAPVHFDLSLPMLTDAGGSLPDGASGKFDMVFRDIGRVLVADGHSDAIIRIGWEANAGWMPWAASKDPGSYKAYWRRIVTTMRQIPGQRFSFEWCMQAGRFDIDPESIYPGDDVVDLVGLDIYDEDWAPTGSSPEARFELFKDEPDGLAWIRDFGARHSKRVAYSEWAVTTRADGRGGGDDDYFVRQMAQWFKQTDAAVQVYFDLNLPGQYDDTLGEGSHPRASAAYRTAFGPS